VLVELAEADVDAVELDALPKVVNEGAADPDTDAVEEELEVVEEDDDEPEEMLNSPLWARMPFVLEETRLMVYPGPTVKSDRLETVYESDEVVTLVARVSVKPDE